MLKIFISYSHQDTEWKKRLTAQLNVLKMEGFLDFWDDQQIHWGDNWVEELDRKLEEANIAILLISAEFLNSKFIREKEIPPLIERRTQEKIKIFPLIIKDCPWQFVPWLSGIQVRPKDGKPLSDMNRGQVDKILVSLVKEIINTENNKAMNLVAEKILAKNKSQAKNKYRKLIVIFTIITVIAVTAFIFRIPYIPKPISGNHYINKVTVTPPIGAANPANPVNEQKIVFSLSTQPRDFRHYDSSRTNLIYANFKTSQPMEKLEIDWGENGEGYVGVENFRNSSAKEGGWYLYSIIHKFQELGIKEIKAKVVLEGDNNPCLISRQFEIEVID